MLDPPSDELRHLAHQGRRQPVQVPQGPGSDGHTDDRSVTGDEVQRHSRSAVRRNRPLLQMWPEPRSTMAGQTASTPLTTPLRLSSNPSTAASSGRVRSRCVTDPREARPDRPIDEGGRLHPRQRCTLSVVRPHRSPGRLTMRSSIFGSIPTACGREFSRRYWLHRAICFERKLS